MAASNSDWSWENVDVAIPPLEPRPSIRAPSPIQADALTEIPLPQPPVESSTESTSREDDFNASELINTRTSAPVHSTKSEANVHASRRSRPDSSRATCPTTGAIKKFCEGLVNLLGFLSLPAGLQILASVVCTLDDSLNWAVTGALGLTLLILGFSVWLDLMIALLGPDGVAHQVQLALQGTRKVRSCAFFGFFAVLHSTEYFSGEEIARFCAPFMVLAGLGLSVWFVVQAADAQPDHAIDKSIEVEKQETVEIVKLDETRLSEPAQPTGSAANDEALMQTEGSLTLALTTTTSTKPASDSTEDWTSANSFSLLTALADVALMISVISLLGMFSPYHMVNKAIGYALFACTLLPFYDSCRPWLRKKSIGRNDVAIIFSSISLLSLTIAIAIMAFPEITVEKLTSLSYDVVIFSGEAVTIFALRERWLGPIGVSNEAKNEPEDDLTPAEVRDEALGYAKAIDNLFTLILDLVLKAHLVYLLCHLTLCDTEFGEAIMGYWSVRCATLAIMATSPTIPIFSWSATGFSFVWPWVSDKITRFIAACKIQAARFDAEWPAIRDEFNRKAGIVVSAIPEYFGRLVLAWMVACVLLQSLRGEEGVPQQYDRVVEN